jgi:hypothetical protein
MRLITAELLTTGATSFRTNLRLRTPQCIAGLRLALLQHFIGTLV